MTINRILFPWGWRGSGMALGFLLILTTALYVPAALAFPHQQEFGLTKVYSVQPIPDVMELRIKRADQLLATSPLNEPGLKRTLVLTDGGWRWKVMGFGTWDAIALRRPFSRTLVINRADVLQDRASNNAPIGGVRTLPGTIAHETVHVLTARRLGEWGLARLPQWKREGYADYVVNETSIGANDEAHIRARDPSAPVLAYYESRRRVAERLRRNGNSIDELFLAN